MTLKDLLQKLRMEPDQPRSPTPRSLLNIPDSLKLFSGNGLRNNFEDPPPPLEDLREWQRELKTLLDEPPNDRTVYWIYGTEGNEGKSWFGRHYRSPPGTKGVARDGYYVTGGKFGDIQYGYQFQRVVFFDWARKKSMEEIPWSVIENFKNGIFFSSKYESSVRRFRPPHVVVLSNYLPDRDSLSRDRWKVFEIKEDKLWLRPYFYFNAS